MPIYDNNKDLNWFNYTCMIEAPPFFKGGGASIPPAELSCHFDFFDLPWGRLWVEQDIFIALNEKNWSHIDLGPGHNMGRREYHI